MRKKTESYRLVVGSTAARKVLVSSIDFITHNSIEGHVKQGKATLNSFIESHLHWFLLAIFLNPIQKPCWWATSAYLRNKKRNICDHTFIHEYIPLQIVKRINIWNTRICCFCALIHWTMYCLENVDPKCLSKIRNLGMQYLV